MKNSSEFELLKNTWRNSPRVRGPMADAFRDYVLGVRRPHTSPLIEDGPELFHHDPDLLRFRESYLKHCGIFKHHFVSNIPYIYQHDCSLGNAFTNYLLQVSSDRNNSPVSLWTIGNSEGVLSRTVAALGNGVIHTLNNVETKENEIAFNQVRPPTAHFLGETFCEVTDEYLNTLPTAFPKKFTLIHENLSFQMIQNNRREQLAYVSQFLEEGGLFTATEKCTIPNNPSEYHKWEEIKNRLFKDRYIHQHDMEYDEHDLQTFMEQAQVGFEQLLDEVERLYPHIAVIWNSCNFYTIVASTDATKVQRFCAQYYPPYIATECIYLAIGNKPLVVRGLDGFVLNFRSKHNHQLTN